MGPQTPRDRKTPPKTSALKPLLLTLQLLKRPTPVEKAVASTSAARSNPKKRAAYKKDKPAANKARTVDGLLPRLARARSFRSACEGLPQAIKKVSRFMERPAAKAMIFFGLMMFVVLVLYVLTR